jgi:hypothetical protein
MVADHPCRPNRPIRLMFDLGEADPFVGVPIADAGPAQGLRDRRCDHLGGDHPPDDRQVRGPVNFLGDPGVRAPGGGVRGGGVPRCLAQATVPGGRRRAAACACRLSWCSRSCRSVPAGGVLVRRFSGRPGRPECPDFGHGDLPMPEPGRTVNPDPGSRGVGRPLLRAARRQG